MNTIIDKYASVTKIERLSKMQKMKKKSTPAPRAYPISKTLAP